MEIRHEDVRANGVRLHVARTGEGPPLVTTCGTWET